MTDKRRVYTKVKQTLKKMMPQTPQNQIVTIAMMVAGIVLGRKTQLSVISLGVPHPAKPASLEKRMQRFVKNKRTDVTVNYLPFAQLILNQLSGHSLVLAIDGSCWAVGTTLVGWSRIYLKKHTPKQVGLGWVVSLISVLIAFGRDWL